MRAGLSVGVIVALVIAIWVAVSSGDDEPAPTTLETTTTSATTLTTTTTTTPPATTATTSGSTTTPTETTVDEEARIEEVRLILEDLYFRWFDAIYRNDEEAVREAIATERYLTDFRNAVDSLDIPRQPEREDVAVSGVEILRDSESCLVTYATVDARQLLGDEGEGSRVNVLLYSEGRWKLATVWTNKTDLWQQDCEIQPEL